MSRKAPAVQTPVETNVSFWIHGSKKSLIINNHDDGNWRHTMPFEAVREIRLIMDTVFRDKIVTTVTRQIPFGLVNVTAHGNLFKVIAQPSDLKIRRLEATLSASVMDCMLAEIRDITSAQPTEREPTQVGALALALA